MPKKRRSGRSVALGNVDGGSTTFVGALRIERSTGTVQVDSSKLAPPDVVYDADVAWLEYSPGSLTFMFAKAERGDAKAFRSRLEIRYPPERVVTTFWNSSSQEFLTTLSSHVARWPAEAHAQREVDINLPARQAHSQWAGLTHLAFAGSEATVDFYHLSASALAELKRSGSTASLKLSSVVRVQMSSFELHRWLRKVEAAIDQIVSAVPKSELGEHEEASADDGEPPESAEASAVSLK